ncbi:unnamed protein product [Orchesella dallaii]|uniref:Peptidase S1 domain-containing protein n=1 Tax=Orchesella dallaii TaxID=48710 RepID=A0ABP1S8J0_9HEXA
MAKSSKFLRAAVASFIILFQLANINCQQCNGKHGPQGQCGYGTSEVWRILKNGQRSITACCHPMADVEEKMEITAMAEGCSPTPCAPKFVPDACTILPNYVVKGKSLVYEATFRENCSNSRHPSGYTAYCSRPGLGSGDSGGPAICRDSDGEPVLCGITSFSIGGTECIKEQDGNYCYPGVFVKVSNFKDWAKQKVPEGQDEDTIIDSPLYGRPTSAPHQVRVTSVTGKSCGGTLIQPDLVVTAAHCITHDEMTLLRGIKVKTTQGQIMELAGSPAVMTEFKNLPKPNIPAENTKRGVKRVVMDENFY